MSSNERISKGLYDLKYASLSSDDGGRVGITIVNDTDMQLIRSEYRPSSSKNEAPAEQIDSGKSTVTRMDKWNLGEIHNGLTSISYKPRGGDDHILMIRITAHTTQAHEFSTNIWGGWEHKGYRVGYTKVNTNHFLVVLRKLPFVGQRDDSSAQLTQKAVDMPCAVGWGDKAYVFYQGSNNSLQYSSFDKGAFWSEQKEQKESGLTDTPSAVVFKDKIYVFYQGPEKREFLYNIFNPRDGHWEGQKIVKSLALVNGPSATVLDGKIHIVHQSGADDKSLRHVTYDGQSGWSADITIPGVQCLESPSVVAYKGKLYCFYHGQVPEGGLYVVEYDGKTWGNHRLSDGVKMSNSPSAVVAKGEIYVFHEGGPHDNGTLFCKKFDGVSMVWEGDIWNVGTTGGPGAAAVGETLFCFHLGGQAQVEGGESRYQLFCVAIDDDKK